MEQPTRANPSVLRVADVIARLGLRGRTLVAIDGVDGAGKTTFAEILATSLPGTVVRASCDDFLNPKAVRYARGRESPTGFYLDSFDYDSLEEMLLRPFRSGATFRRRRFDASKDRTVEEAPSTAPPDAVLIFDGLFLHRRRLRSWWDVSVLLDVPRATAEARLIEREGRAPSERYIAGQDLYFADADPSSHASLVVPW